MPAKYHTKNVTELLRKWSAGDFDALDELTPLILEDLRRLARAHFAREPAGHTLQPTALINEVFIRLLEREKVQWDNRGQFFRAATDIMHRILVDHARRRLTAKRGGNVRREALDENLADVPTPRLDYLALSEALEQEDHLCRQIVELKFYFGLKHREIAELLNLSPDTVKAKWAATRVRLHRALQQGA